MSLTDLLRKFRPAAFGLALVVSPVYSLNCGGEEEPSKACVSDTECKGDDRICADGQCVYRDGRGDGGSSEEGPCGNSPLNGKYLWDFGSCQTGSVSPGDPASCTFEYTKATDIGVPDLTAARIYKYHGNTIRFGVDDYTLSREFLCSSVPPEDQSLCSSFQCAIENDLGFYILIPPNERLLRLKSNLWKIDTTWIWGGPRGYCPYGDPVVNDCFSDGEL